MLRFIVGFVLGVSMVWTGLMFFFGLLMSTGLADEPGDTNGFKRFLFTTFVMGLPGWIGVLVCIIILRRLPQPQSKHVEGFPILLAQRQSDSDSGSGVDEIHLMSESDAQSEREGD